jgi:pantothenate kinase
MSFSGTKTLIGTLGGKCKFYALLDQSANIKVIEHHKPSNFHIGEFSS